MFDFVCSTIEWSLNTGVDKISNEVCMLANLCSTFFCGSDFLQLSHIFRQNAQKNRKKVIWEKLNVDRQFFKDAICIF